MSYQRYCFCYISDFIFYGVSYSKTDLHNEYMANFMFGSLFEQDYQLNVIIKEFMQNNYLK